MTSTMTQRLLASDAARASGITIPEELDRAWAWMESRGWGSQTGGAYHITPYAGDRQLGIVFCDIPDDFADAWFGPKAAATAGKRLLPLGELSGAGGSAALWRDDAGALRFVGLGSEGETYMLADSAIDFLRLCAIGYSEITPLYLGEEPSPDDHESVAGHAEFRQWVQQTFSVDVPALWEPVDDGVFTAWVDALVEGDE